MSALALSVTAPGVVSIALLGHFIFLFMNLSEWEALLISDLRRANALRKSGKHYDAEHYLSCARDAIVSMDKLAEAYADDSFSETLASEEYMNEGRTT